jgi:transcriptional regulator with XRE-family HTH domain
MNLKDFRKMYGITQMDMCELIGVSLNAYILWERGISTPNPENQEKIDKVIARITKELE